MIYNNIMYNVYIPFLVNQFIECINSWEKRNNYNIL